MQLSKHILLAVALALFTTVSIAVPPVTGVQVQSHTQRLYRSVTGAECKTVVDGWTCVSVAAREEGDWAGIYLQTTVEVTESLNNDSGYEIRHVSCPVDAARLQVAKNWASLSVSMDSDSPDCFKYGEKVTFDPPSNDLYYFSGIVTAEGNWLNPGNQFKQNGNTVQTDNVTGQQQRENCQYYGAWQVLGGGFTVQGIFHPFGTGDSAGDFSSNHCNIIAR